MTAVDLASNQMRDVFPNIRESWAEDSNPLYRNRNQHHKAMVEKMLNTSVNTSLVLNPKQSEKSDKKDKEKEKMDKLTSRQKNIYKMYQCISSSRSIIGSKP